MSVAHAAGNGESDVCVQGSNAEKLNPYIFSCIHALSLDSHMYMLTVCDFAFWELSQDLK